MVTLHFRTDIRQIAGGRVVFDTIGIHKSEPIKVSEEIQVFIDGDAVRYKAKNSSYLDFLYQYERHFIESTRTELGYSDTPSKICAFSR